MSPIASLMSQTQMRRSLIGARATDPVLHDRPRRSRHRGRGHVPSVARARRDLGGSPTPQTADAARGAC